MTDWYIPPLRPLFPSAVWMGSPPDIYLTLDDGPHEHATARVLDILEAEAVQATFFVTGKNAEARPDLMQRISTSGHTIGNHGYSHRSYLRMSWQEIERDVLLGQEAIVRTTRVQPALFRPPYGRMRPSLPGRLANMGLTTVLWGVNSWDYDLGVSEEKIVSMVVKRTCPGDIILLHDNEKSANRIERYLRQLIVALKARSSSFARL